jgi:hypothetical protein
MVIARQPVTERRPSRSADRRKYPPIGTPPTMIVRLVADIQNGLFWRVGTGRAS